MIKLIFIFLSISLKAQDFQNVFFINNSADEAANLKIINSLSNSLAYGFFANRALNFNGIHSLINPKKSEDLPYQAIRMLSLFDLYFTHSSLNFQKNKTEKIHNVYLSTIMEKNEISDYQTFLNSNLDKYGPIAKTFLPFLENLHFKSFNQEDISYTDMGPVFSESFSKKIKSKVKDKLGLIWTRVQNFSDTGVTYQEALNNIILPINFLTEIHLDANKNNYYQIDIILPGLVNVKKENRRGMYTDNPLEWKLEPGIIKKFTPPLIGLADRLERMSYLKDTPEGTQWNEIKNKLIHIQLYKNLNNLDKMEMTVEFGEIPEENYVENKKESRRLKLFPIDISKRRSALKIDGFMALPKGKTLNKIFNEFKIEAYIHRLSFDLIREGKFKSWQERFDTNSTFKMLSKKEKTFLSLRVKKGTHNLKDTWPLKKMGFTCEKPRELYRNYRVLAMSNYSYTCFLDLSNVEEYKSEFIPKFGRQLTRKVIGAFAKLELNTFLKNLQQMNKLDLSEEKKLFEEIIFVFRENQLLFEYLNFLPKEIKDLTK